MSMMEKMKKLMAEPIGDEEEEGGWDEDYDWEGEEGAGDNWNEGYEEEEGAEGDYEILEYEDQEPGQMVPGAQMRPLRVMSNAANRQCNVGLHTIEIYYPQFYINQIEMEEYDATDARYGPSVIGKYTKGIGQVEARFPTDDEDPVSFGMTVVHRLIERMDKLGFNQTANYSEDGKMLPHWNSIGRLDVGSESLIDRSKSMKTCLMDLFERYGNGEADIEGVDMYNACYGGQAAGLCCLNWVESDRWDGRYGLGIATDIAEAHNSALFCVGASCAGSLFFPDAPLTHYSLRASCVLHRYDFFKPVGWHQMAPLSDGKYSVNAYMDCVDMCHLTLKAKMNGQSIVKACGYNVFHTGGGFHIVKKAYDRMIRSDDVEKQFTLDDKNQLRTNKLIPSTYLLKIVGPTHTVSSFLNMSSVVMSEWERALGKTLVVFTYGSGSAATMYQTLFNDLMWMKPIHNWYVDFYGPAMKLHPQHGGFIHDIYSAVWSKFGYIPHGRQLGKIDPWKYEATAYYLMEIDAYGRRFYHRGGMAAEPMDKKWELAADINEARRVRADFGPLPPKPDEDKKKAKTVDEIWQDVEAEMLCDYEPPQKEVLQTGIDKSNPGHLIVCQQIIETADLNMVKHDGGRHSYQIVGSWTGFQEAQDMHQASDTLYVYDFTVGENGFEEFFLIQDGSRERKICPAVINSWKSMPCVGPYNMAGEKHWLLDARFGAPLEDVGSPGDRYRVTFNWSHHAAKQLDWSKLEGQTAPYPKGQYYISGSWTPDFLEMEGDGEGKFSKEVAMTHKSMEFFIVRNRDEKQRIYPDVELDNSGGAKTKGYSGDRVLGVDAWPEDKIAPVWELRGKVGDKRLISFYRNPDLPDEMDVEWTAESSTQDVVKDLE